MEASGVSGMRGDKGYVQIEGLGVTGVSLDKGTREAIEEEPVLEFILFPVLWCENEAGAG